MGAASMNNAEKPKSTFTARKLDWLTAICFDRRVGDYAYRVVSVIARHLNEKTGRAFVGDETIAFETGSKWRGKVHRARNQLRDFGWLEWQHSKTANIYKPVFTNVAPALQIVGRVRYEKRQRFLDNRARLSHRWISQPKMPDCTKIDSQTVPPVDHKHLRRTP
jgi:hypothetical protein